MHIFQSFRVQTLCPCPLCQIHNLKVKFTETANKMSLVFLFCFQYISNICYFFMLDLIYTGNWGTERNSVSVCKTVVGASAAEMEGEKKKYQMWTLLYNIRACRNSRFENRNSWWDEVVTSLNFGKNKGALSVAGGTQLSPSWFKLLKCKWFKLPEV